MRRPVNCGGRQAEVLFATIWLSITVCLLRRPGTLIVGEEVDEFVLKDAGAAWLQHDDGHARVYLRSKLVEDATEIAAGFIEEAEVIERTSAADMFSYGCDGVAGGVKDFGCGGEGLGMESSCSRCRAIGGLLDAAGFLRKMARI